MPYILYSLKTDRAKYLSASVVSPKGTCDALSHRVGTMRVSLKASLTLRTPLGVIITPSSQPTLSHRVGNELALSQV